MAVSILRCKNNRTLNDEIVYHGQPGCSEKNTRAPVAISTISTRLINETKATIDQLINKTSGVYMVNLGNDGMPWVCASH
jgi:hypothetical protein